MRHYEITDGASGGYTERLDALRRVYLKPEEPERKSHKRTEPRNQFGNSSQEQVEAPKRQYITEADEVDRQFKERKEREQIQALIDEVQEIGLLRRVARVRKLGWDSIALYNGQFYNIFGKRLSEDKRTFEYGIVDSRTYNRLAARAQAKKDATGADYVFPGFFVGEDEIIAFEMGQAELVPRGYAKRILSQPAWIEAPAGFAAAHYGASRTISGRATPVSNEVTSKSGKPLRRMKTIAERKADDARMTFGGTMRLAAAVGGLGLLASTGYIAMDSGLKPDGKHTAYAYTGVEPIDPMANPPGVEVTDEDRRLAEEIVSGWVPLEGPVGGPEGEEREAE